MNIKNVAKREILDFSQFRGKVHDDTYKPLAPSNQSEGGLEKSGLSAIKRQPAYDHVGYADAVFRNGSKIDVPGIRFDTKTGMADGLSTGSTFITQTSESEGIQEERHIKLYEFFFFGKNENPFAETENLKAFSFTDAASLKELYESNEILANTMWCKMLCQEEVFNSYVKQGQELIVILNMEDDDVVSAIMEGNKVVTGPVDNNNRTTPEAKAKFERYAAQLGI